MVAKSLAEYGFGAFVGDAVNVGFTIKDYNDQRNQGNSRASSLMKAGTSFLSGEMVWSSMNKYVGSHISNVIGGGLKRLGAKEAVAGVVGGGLSMVGTAALMALPGMASMYGAFAENTANIMSKSYSNKGKFGSGYFNMSEAGYTMRQRSLNAIRSNGLNTQSVLGNEARNYYRGVVQ